MNKKQSKQTKQQGKRDRLKIGRETVKALSSDDLGQVVGGKLKGNSDTWQEC